MPDLRFHIRNLLVSVITLITTISCSTHVEEARVSTTQEQRDENVMPSPVKPDKNNDQNPMIYNLQSTEGKDLLNRARFNSSELESFLARNREADYVFVIEDKKLFLVYQNSNNLYQFFIGTNEPYKKYHPIPASIAEHLVRSAPPSSAESAQILDQNTTPTSGKPLAIEATLNDKKPEPYLDDDILSNIPYAISGLGGHTPIYPKFFYLDKKLRDTIENDYSFKYDSKKQRLRLILPQAYEGGSVYSEKSPDARKIYLYRSDDKTVEHALIVPDFFPGSRNYYSARGKTLKAFGSLYDIDLANTDTQPERLRIRYELRLCQQDELHYCANKTGKKTYIRAIVISAVIYDESTLRVIDAYALK